MPGGRAGALADELNAGRSRRNLITPNKNAFNLQVGLLFAVIQMARLSNR
jgi:hypothetical protein